MPKDMRSQIAARLQAVRVERAREAAPQEPIAEQLDRVKRKALRIAEEQLDRAETRGDAAEIARAHSMLLAAIKHAESGSGIDERDAAAPRFLVEFADPAQPEDMALRAEPEETGGSADVVSIVAPENDGEESRRSRRSA